MPADNSAPVSKAALIDAIRELREFIDERTHEAETRLLPAFESHPQAQGI